MRRFITISKWIVLGTLCLAGILVAALNVYYAVLLNVAYRPPGDPAAELGPPDDKELSQAPVAKSPSPLQHIRYSEGVFRMPQRIIFSSGSDLAERIVEQFMGLFDVEAQWSGGTAIFRFNRTVDLPPEGYRLRIRSDHVDIDYSDARGTFYALTTLRQIHRQTGENIPCLVIEDFPDFPVRGVMLDISRDKIPKLETLYQIVDLLAELKINHFELYVEGFSYAYPSFRHLWEGKETPLTGEEIRQIDQYCRERFIDLVPNQNSLGHMEAWLETDEYADLAECPEGIRLLGFLETKATLNPLDPRSIELVEKMTDDILPNFSSQYFNANLDQPFELGRCKSSAEAEKVGVGQLYADFANKVYDLLRTRNKKMLMWADVLHQHPEIEDLLPEDVTLLEWGYEANYPFEPYCKRFQQAGRAFYVCPGTSSSTTITGRTDNMKRNIRHAVTVGKRYGAAGVLNTDWGDMGHWQYLPISYAGFVYGAALSWNVESSDQVNLGAFLDRFVFADAEYVMGDLVMDLGRYNRYEDFLMANMTLTFLGYQIGLVDKVLFEAILEMMVRKFSVLADETIGGPLGGALREAFLKRKGYDYKGLCQYIQQLETRLDSAQLDSPDANLVLDELRNAILMIRLGSDLRHYIDFENRMTLTERENWLRGMQERCQEVIDEHKRLWISRNKPGGLGRSVAALQNLDRQISEELAGLETNFIFRLAARLYERTIAAGGALYLKLS